MSYERVNYSIRPAKNIERKMLCDAFRRLEKFQRLESYRYVGLGSTFFSDFVLFHKALGITNNISMEKEIEKRDRFLFNKPYNCIEMKFADSHEILPQLDWDARTIVWLDYDDQLDMNMLEDVSCVATNAPSGSVLVVTVDATPDKVDSYGKRLKTLKRRIGEDRVPLELTEPMLGEWGTADAYQQIIDNEISMTVSFRNGGAMSAEQKLSYLQLFNFRYQDGSAKMCAVGGIFYQARDKPRLKKCRFNDLEFVRNGRDPYFIDVPILTLREIRHLDAQLPCEQGQYPVAPAVPKQALKDYARLYKYFPSYVDADVA